MGATLGFAWSPEAHQRQDRHSGVYPPSSSRAVAPTNNVSEPSVLGLLGRAVGGTLSAVMRAPTMARDHLCVL